MEDKCTTVANPAEMAEGDDTFLDPRIKEELDILNQASMDVNRMENELDEARTKYRTTFASSSQKMEEIGCKIRKNIHRARLFFELTEKAKEAQSEALRAARQYQTANGIYRAAKETIALAELRLIDHDSQSAQLSSAWQEMLNHATVRVMEAEREKTRSEAEHNTRAAVFAEVESQLHLLEKKYKRSISRARPYFEMKAELELKLQQLKQNVSDLQQAIAASKARYAEALDRLESISEEIHESRRNKLLLMFPREPGVGAESDSLGSSISDTNLEKDIFPLSSSSFADSCIHEDESDEESDMSCQSRLTDDVFTFTILTNCLEATNGLENPRRKRDNSKVCLTISSPRFDQSEEGIVKATSDLATHLIKDGHSSLNRDFLNSEELSTRLDGDGSPAVENSIEARPPPSLTICRPDGVCSTAFVRALRESAVDTGLESAESEGEIIPKPCDEQKMLDSNCNQDNNLGVNMGRIPEDKLDHSVDKGKASIPRTNSCKRHKLQGVMLLDPSQLLNGF